jgi:hypothetical protein
VVDTSDFEDDGTVFFDLPEDGVELLKKYTATFKFRLGDEWESGAIVPFSLFNELSDTIVVNAIVR